MTARKNTEHSIDGLCDDAEYWCTKGDLGYDQWQRESWRDSGWQEGTEVDCSSLTCGLLVRHGYQIAGATYTGNMRSNLVKCGWRVVANDGHPRRGDILLNDGHHVAIYLGNGRLAQASRGEAGHRVHGGRAGDQDGYETNVRAYYDYPWACYLRLSPETASAPVELPLSSQWWCGPTTTKRWQAACGTPADGAISGQLAAGDRYRRNVTTCEHGGGGSQLVRHVQAKVGADADGLWGEQTSRRIQAFLVAQGYGLVVDGYFGSESVRALCRSLDAKPGIWR